MFEKVQDYGSPRFNNSKNTKTLHNCSYYFLENCFYTPHDTIFNNTFVFFSTYNNSLVHIFPSTTQFMKDASAKKLSLLKT
jgi:hypothetical protein